MFSIAEPYGLFRRGSGKSKLRFFKSSSGSADGGAPQKIVVQQREEIRLVATIETGFPMTDTKKKILCIEDDHETAALIAEELVDRGFKAIIADDGREGFAAILKEAPDLVLCDIIMRKMSGFEVLDQLIKTAPRFAQMPFVFLTGLTDQGSRLRGRQLGADDYIIKPIDFDMLDSVITARLAHVAQAGILIREANVGGPLALQQP
jgi:CheY-like chemotaxis protein